MSALYGTYARSELAFERGEGMRLYDQQGRDYLDFHSGIAVNALGHGDPHLVSALKAAAEKVWHTSNVFSIPEQERLGQRLVDATFADKVFFTNSGAEALECAIKTARHYAFSKGQPDRYEIIAFTGAFHGRTLGTIAAGGNPSYIEGFGPAVAGFKHTAPGDLEAVKALVGAQTCAILIEPVQGEGGVTAMSNEFLQGLRQICDENDLVLIFDEVQCGFGRTGRFFAHEWSGVTPDIVAVAKAIGGGFPLGACLATEAVAASMVPGTHGSTYGGNPMACAVGNAVLDRILAPGFLDQVNTMGQRLAWHLGQLAQKYPDYVLELRGKGLLAGIKITPPVRDFVGRLRDDHRLLTIGAGDNVLRLLPPLIVTEADIEEAMAKLGAAFDAIEAETAATPSAS
ncbi:MAG: aspartate aminotransferase family protein [Devosia sp.]|jgi:acetylornithine/N-succinyldiaminopimelate aminotransferase|uniref:aspartate aminotransferase family protein n=1 Tax=unclassified Devosia TaxID=196773 RepID=UPI0019E5A715|nr:MULTISPECIES: aspartate aminotransferase family protein [unclassified Devosia]MBF0680011.1 aspartate aminotransferase family protein [Devosia sp.]WEJ33039.1 aspartate aminotransferase family protein [Devosia sp. SD17-2]